MTNQYVKMQYSSTNTKTQISEGQNPETEFDNTLANGSPQSFLIESYLAWKMSANLRNNVQKQTQINQDKRNAI